MTDFSLLPPEVNSGRMYTGSGPVPLLAAAESWQALAAQLNSAAASYRGVLSDLVDGVWHGESATLMNSSAQPYVDWMAGTAAQAAQVAAQARAAVAAYEAAFAATVPPEAVAANRTILAELIATNILGQNAPAIAANQAEYAEMWAQDAAAMHGYAANAAAATQLPALAAAPRNGSSPKVHQPVTNPAGPLLQLIQAFQGSPFNEALEPHMVAINDFLGYNQGFLWFSTMWVTGAEPLFSAPLAFGWPFGMASRIAAGAMMGGSGVFSLGAPAMAMSDVSGGLAAGTLASAPSAAATPGAPAYGGVSAGMGRATLVGGFSAPSTWGSAVSEIKLASATLPATGLGAVPQGGMPGAGMPGLGGLGGGMPLVGSVVNTPKQGQGSTQDDAAADEMSTGGGEQRVPAAASTLSERDELNKLRAANADLERETEVLRRSAMLFISEATDR